MRISNTGIAVALGMSLALGACALVGGSSFPPDTAARAAVDVPPRFDPRIAEDRLAPADTLAGTGCLSPLVHPAAGTEIRMVRSLGGRGDYEVPAGAYGVGPGELLRVECNTGRVIGVVER